MSEQTPQSDNDRQDASASPDQPRPPRKTPVADFFSRISITQLTLAVMVVVFLWQWLDERRIINDMQQQLAKKIAETEGISKADRLLLMQSQDQASELYAKVAMLETRYADLHNQRGALESLYNDLSVSRDETALAEVEQMLLNAAQQLQLSANVRAALIAMQSADARLQRIGRPSFNDLRKTIGQDMDRLRTLPNVDITGINHQLTKLIAAVDELPLAYQQRVADEKLFSGHPNEPIAQMVPPKSEGSFDEAQDRHLAGNTDETSGQKLLREIWQEVKQLVRVENTGKDELPLLLPNQEFFLRENLKLRLLSARIALLSRDEVVFRQELKTTLQWTARYFDTRSPAGSAMLAGMKRLAASGISVELPDLSPSLQAVRNYRLTREKAAR